MHDLAADGVQFRAAVPIVCERRVDLPERQVRMQEVKLLGTPPIRLLINHQLHDLCSGAHDARNVMYS